MALDVYAALETALELNRRGLRQAATLNTVAAAVWAFSPLAGAFTASAAYAELLAHEPGKAEFSIAHTTGRNGIILPVREDNSLVLPHATLKRFVKPGLTDEVQPNVLVIAPLSGHPATLLKSTVEEMLPDHNVYVTDWHDPKNVPLSEGSFSLDDYISYLTKFLAHIGPNAHVVAVCQPGVPLVAALSVMEERGDPNLPLSATIMGSPLDTSISPTKVNEGPQRLKRLFGSSEGVIANFEATMIHPVSAAHAGHGQPVYPGLMQLAGFYSLAPGDHMSAFRQNWFNVALAREQEGIDRHETFYRGYNHVMDLPGRYLTQTMDTVFLNKRLMDGSMVYKDPETGEAHQIDVRNLKNTGIFAVEGKKDTITGIGQTAAILQRADRLSPDMVFYRLTPTGHYGLFAGGDYRNNTAPQTRGFIREMAALRGISYTPTHMPVKRPEHFSAGRHQILLEQSLEAA